MIKLTGGNMAVKLRLPFNLYVKLSRIGKKQDRSLNYLIVKAVEKSLNESDDSDKDD